MASSFADARASHDQAQAALDFVHAAKRSASSTPAGTDLNVRNLERARRERWNNGSLGAQHTPRQ